MCALSAIEFKCILIYGYIAMHYLLLSEKKDVQDMMPVQIFIMVNDIF